MGTKRLTRWDKQIARKHKMDNLIAKEDPSLFKSEEHVGCNKIIGTSYVNRDEAIKFFNDNNLKAEWTRVMKDDTKRWFWTIRDSEYKKIGYILAHPSSKQIEKKDYNNPWLASFDYMEITKHSGVE